MIGLLEEVYQITRAVQYLLLYEASGVGYVSSSTTSAPALAALVRTQPPAVSALRFLGAELRRVMERESRERNRSTAVLHSLPATLPATPVKAAASGAAADGDLVTTVSVNLALAAAAAVGDERAWTFGAPGEKSAGEPDAASADDGDRHVSIDQPATGTPVFTIKRALDLEPEFELTRPQMFIS